MITSYKFKPLLLEIKWLKILVTKIRIKKEPKAIAGMDTVLAKLAKLITKDDQGEISLAPELEI